MSFLFLIRDIFKLTEPIHLVESDAFRKVSMLTTWADEFIVKHKKSIVMYRMIIVKNAKLIIMLHSPNSIGFRGHIVVNEMSFLDTFFA